MARVHGAMVSPRLAASVLAVAATTLSCASAGRPEREPARLAVEEVDWRRHAFAYFLDLKERDPEGRSPALRVRVRWVEPPQPLRSRASEEALFRVEIMEVYAGVYGPPTGAEVLLGRRIHRLRNDLFVGAELTLSASGADRRIMNEHPVCLVFLGPTTFWGDVHTVERAFPDLKRGAG